MKTDQQYDAIVVGSGPGGATVAKELSCKGKKVLILEWGSNAKIRASILQMLSMAGIPGKGFLYSSGLPVVRGITTGGSSVFYYGSAYEPPYEMLRSHGVDIEEEVKEIKKELPLAPLKDDLIGPMAGRIMKSARELGYDWHKMEKFIFQDKCLDSQNKFRSKCSSCVYGCPYGAKWNARMYIEEAVRNGAVLKSKAKAQKVLVENNRAFGVEYTVKKKKFTAHAEKIILGAGGVGSPVILRASGIKDAGYDFFYDPLVTVMGQVKDIKGGKELPMVAGVHLDDEGLLMTDMMVAKGMYRGFNVPPLKLGKMFSHNRTMQIMIKIDDKLGGMLNDDGGVRKALAEADIQRLFRGVDLASEVLRNAGAENPYYAMAMAGHPGGTVKIDEIVDSNLKTEYDNLYVCDCSVVPEPPGLPPTLMLLGLGKRLAKHLTGE